MEPGSTEDRLSKRIYNAVSEKIFTPMRDGVKLGANLVRPDRPMLLTRRSPPGPLSDTNPRAFRVVQGFK
jgi:predicted acyl esterase